MTDPTLTAILEEVRAIREALEGPGDDGLLTAQEVADLLGVDRTYVYSRADRLGAIRLPSPSGDRPRLRFRRSVALGGIAEVEKSRQTPRRMSPEIELLPIAGPGDSSDKPTGHERKRRR